MFSKQRDPTRSPACPIAKHGNKRPRRVVQLPSSDVAMKLESSSKAAEKILKLLDSKIRNLEKKEESSRRKFSNRKHGHAKPRQQNPIAKARSKSAPIGCVSTKPRNALFFDRENVRKGGWGDFQESKPKKNIGFYTQKSPAPSRQYDGDSPNFYTSNNVRCSHSYNSLPGLESKHHYKRSPQRVRFQEVDDQHLTSSSSSSRKSTRSSRTRSKTDGEFDHKIDNRYYKFNDGDISFTSPNYHHQQQHGSTATTGNNNSYRTSRYPGVMKTSNNNGTGTGSDSSYSFRSSYNNNTSHAGRNVSSNKDMMTSSSDPNNTMMTSSSDPNTNTSWDDARSTVDGIVSKYDAKFSKMDKQRNDYATTTATAALRGWDSLLGGSNSTISNSSSSHYANHSGTGSGSGSCYSGNVGKSSSNACENAYSRAGGGGSRGGGGSGMMCSLNRYEKLQKLLDKPALGLSKVDSLISRYSGVSRSSQYPSHRKLLPGPGTSTTYSRSSSSSFGSAMRGAALDLPWKSSSSSVYSGGNSSSTTRSYGSALFSSGNNWKSFSKNNNSNIGGYNYNTMTTTAAMDDQYSGNAPDSSTVLKADNLNMNSLHYYSFEDSRPGGGATPYFEQNEYSGQNEYCGYRSIPATSTKNQTLKYAGGYASSLNDNKSSPQQSTTEFTTPRRASWEDMLARYNTNNKTGSITTSSVYTSCSTAAAAKNNNSEFDGHYDNNDNTKIFEQNSMTQYNDRMKTGTDQDSSSNSRSSSINNDHDSTFMTSEASKAVAEQSDRLGRMRELIDNLVNQKRRVL